MELFKWAQSLEGRKQIEQAKKKAWNDFKSKIPNADDSKFFDEAHLNGVNAVSAEIFFKAGPGYLKSVSGPHRRYWSDDMKKALGIGGFPFQLTLNDIKKPIPASDNPGSFGNLFNEELKIFVTPSEYFTTKFRRIFKKTVIAHQLGKGSRK